MTQPYVKNTYRSSKARTEYSNLQGKVAHTLFSDPNLRADPSVHGSSKKKKKKGKRELENRITALESELNIDESQSYYSKNGQMGIRSSYKPIKKSRSKI